MEYFFPRVSANVFLESFSALNTGLLFWRQKNSSGGSLLMARARIIFFRRAVPRKNRNSCHDLGFGWSFCVWNKTAVFSREVASGRRARSLENYAHIRPYNTPPRMRFKNKYAKERSVKKNERTFRMSRGKRR